jgi:hypothetical protein
MEIECNVKLKLLIVANAQYKIKKNERGGACGGGNPRERDCWGDSGVDGRIMLGWIFRKWDVGVWTGFGWLRIETVGRGL